MRSWIVALLAIGVAIGAHADPIATSGPLNAGLRAPDLVALLADPSFGVPAGAVRTYAFSQWLVPGGVGNYEYPVPERRICWFAEDSPGIETCTPWRLVSAFDASNLITGLDVGRVWCFRAQERLAGNPEWAFGSTGDGGQNGSCCIGVD